MSIIDDLLRIQEALPSLRASMAERRAQLVKDVQTQYGVTLHPGRRDHEVVVSESDWRTLRASVMNDRRIDAVGRGYYLGLGGELTVIAAPDWACDPTKVAAARLIAHLRRPFALLLRRLAAIF